MLSKDDILAALAAVPGPDGKTPLNQSGAIDGVTIRDGKVFVAIRVPPARARELEGMRAAAEAASANRPPPATSRLASRRWA
jgi:ATP-binding protein involved in chromosome partitioning